MDNCVYPLLHLCKGSRICDLCREPVEGFYYRCIPCSFDVHPHCTKIQQIVRTESHPEHSLCLVPSFNKCSACKLSNGYIWLYRCGMCKVKLHIRCVGNVMPMEHSHDNITSSTNNNRSNHGRGVTGARVQEERDNAVQDVVLEEIKIIQSRLELLQIENKKLQDERDNAVKEAKELLGSASRQSHVAFSEFLLLELQQATENFSNSHKIGEGGFGSVFKGFLHNTMVAIKILHPESLQGKPEFEQEVAILSRMRHPNLVTFIGACSENSALIYEYLPNGSLEDRLACQGGTPPLTWQVRTRIIGEICCALLFLHSNPKPIVHGDLTLANILLDGNLVSKLSDFGISRLLTETNTTRPSKKTESDTTRPSKKTETNTNTLMHRTKHLRGTFAYMDPEFLRSGEITVKSDVYSFGIIILQLLTGKPPTNIVAGVEEAIETDSLHLIIDKSAGEWPFVQAKKLVNLGLRCAQMHRRKRPDLESEWKSVQSLMQAASLSVLPSYKSQLDDKGIPSYFMCPIFQEVMKDPCIAADGYTYETEAIKGWLDSGHETSPLTNMPLPHTKLTPNYALRSAIKQWLLEHP
ncbi:U-box domain-containing protein kinase family protein [Rhynchospora pubera]|uniref:RING-type E3 ubiquitin transferase n=1 Tax=Rhynchospora pubera TaxID=906938 RepID=A0AAV8HCZ2_9POAL|nr:U-box domain-containing protein kinase family protein [Rhynchospora pubera]